jgi:cyclic pyranopterin phosphate synthase
VGERDHPVLIDSFGRVATDLRISVTDRCNLRCTYCMPEAGMDWLARSEVLTLEEIVRLVSLFRDEGVRTVRVTGGEPLVRRDICDIVHGLSALGLDDLSMTTNGVLLQKSAAALADAGLQRVNVSLDSLHRDRYNLITRRDDLDAALAGLRAAHAAGLRPVKINCVLMAGVNSDEIVEFAELARSTGYDVRFIEFMPLDEERKWSAEAVVASADVIGIISDVYPLTRQSRGSSPSTPYVFDDGAPGSVGVIASVTEPFCDTCDRLRLSADGRLQTCLFATEQTDLRGPLRSGATDDELREVIRSAVAGKQAGHSIGRVSFVQPTRSMSVVGG